MNIKRTLVAMVARHAVNRAGILAVRRPPISWQSYVRAGGPCTANRGQR